MNAFKQKQNMAIPKGADEVLIGVINLNASYLASLENQSSVPREATIEDERIDKTLPLPSHLYDNQMNVQSMDCREKIQMHHADGQPKISLDSSQMKQYNPGS